MSVESGGEWTSSAGAIPIADQQLGMISSWRQAWPAVLRPVYAITR